ncbi:MAG TPA: phage holin family protein [Acidimicrobiia bacterium]|nr:phage holin family protein [Acidimicrobiia bacterium]
MSTMEPKDPERSLGELLGEMTSNLSTLVRKEIDLARVELKDEVRQAGKAGGMLGGAALVGHLGALLLSLALALGLSEALDADAWLGLFVVGALAVGIAAVLGAQGRNKLQQIDAVPPQTVQTLKEDVQWVKQQTS